MDGGERQNEKGNATGKEEDRGKRKKKWEEEKNETAEKRNAEPAGREDATRMLDASNVPLHGRKRISDLNGNAGGTSFRFTST